MKSPYVIILAAGNSTRLKSRLSKVMHPLCGRPMIDYVLDTARSLRPKKIVLVLGFGRQTILDHLKGQKDLVFVHQKERRGTAHATQVGMRALGKVSGRIVVLNGDVPLLSPVTLKSLMKDSAQVPLALLTAVLPDPTGYGRIIRDPNGNLTAIVEEKNANSSQRQINEINAGVYSADARVLQNNLNKIKKDPVKKEFYLTDLVELFGRQGLSVEGYPVNNPQEILGANTRGELAYLHQRVHDDLIGFHLANGVGMQDPDSVQIDYGVKIGEDTFLGAGAQLLGQTRIGPACKIEAGSILKDVQVQKEVHIKAYSYLEACILKSQATVGPFARIRPGSVVGEQARVGNFVEIKKTRLGPGSKANHLSYLGDTKVGKNANIGAGTITCNYDGKNKYETQIGDEAFIGSDSQLVAPVKVGKGAYVGSGSTITKNVPPDSLAISRAPQRNIKNWKKKK